MPRCDINSLLHMLQANVKVLSDETISDLLVDDDTNSARGDVSHPHTTSASVTELVGHT